MTDDSAPTTQPGRLARNIGRVLGGPRAGQGQVGGDPVTEPEPWDGSDGEPRLGQPYGNMGSTFEDDSTSSTDYDTETVADTGFRYRRPILVAFEQPSDWRPFSISLQANEVEQVLQRNPRRLKAEMYVKTANPVYIGSSAGDGLFGFPAESGLPFITDVTGEAYAVTETAQELYVIEYFRAGPIRLEG